LGQCGARKEIRERESGSRNGEEGRGKLPRRGRLKGCISKGDSVRKRKKRNLPGFFEVKKKSHAKWSDNQKIGGRNQQTSCSKGGEGLSGPSSPLQGAVKGERSLAP